MRWGTVVLLLLLLSPSAAAAPAVGDVVVNGPTEIVVPGGAQKAFSVHVQARVQCMIGFEAPQNLELRVDRAGHAVAEGYLWRVTPDHVALPWQPAKDEPGVHVVDQQVPLIASSEVDPEVAASDRVNVTVIPAAADGRPRCTPEGYTVKNEPFAMEVDVAPQSASVADDSAAVRDGPSVQWIPMVLAIVILATVAVFAVRRERARKQ